MRSKILSVVVPAYNCANYITECVQSVLHGDLEGEVEVIVVDDGSTDGTAEMAATAMNGSRSRTLLIRQPNSGVSSARNAGLAAATGNYVYFLDADDFVHQDFVAVVLGALHGGRPDIVEFNAHTVLEDGRFSRELTLVEHAAGEHVMTQAQRSQTARLFNWYLWMRVFKVDVLTAAPFPVGRNYEDVAVLPSLYTRTRTRTRVQLSDALVSHRLRADSIMHAAKASDCRDWQACMTESLARCVDADSAEYWAPIAFGCLEGVINTVYKVPRGHWAESRSIARAATTEFADAVARSAWVDARWAQQAQVVSSRLGPGRARHQGAQMARQLARRALRRR